MSCRNPRHPPHGRRAERALQLVGQKGNVDRLGERRGDAVLLQPLPQVRGDPVSRHHGHREPGAALQQMAEQREAVHHGHLQVREDGVHLLAVEQLERVLSVLGREHGKDAAAVQRPGEGQSDELVVLDEQQAGRGHGWVRHHHREALKGPQGRGSLAAQIG